MILVSYCSFRCWVWWRILCQKLGRWPGKRWGKINSLSPYLALSLDIEIDTVYVLLYVALRIMTMPFFCSSFIMCSCKGADPDQTRSLYSGTPCLAWGALDPWTYNAFSAAMLSQKTVTPLHNVQNMRNIQYIAFLQLPQLSCWTWCLVIKKSDYWVVNIYYL